jgi:DNA-binding winged helix-turn-helix (wHTH) protein
MNSESGILPETRGINPELVCFDGFSLDLRLRSLHRGTERVKLTPKPFASLKYLVQNRQRVVPKAELLDKIWGGQREVSTVEHAIGQLRRVLGDDAEESRYIQTVPGQGYRFVAEVHPSAETAGSPAAPAPAGTGRVMANARLYRGPLAVAVVLAALVVLGGAITYIVTPARIARGTWNGNTFLAMSDSGRVLWKHAFDAPLRELPADESAWRTQIVDLDGSGVPEVLVAATFGPPGPGGKDEIFCFSSHGTILWRYKPKVEIAFNRPDLNGPWLVTHMVVVPEHRSSSIWVAVAHDVWWPSFIERLSAAGVPRRVFTSSGDIMALRPVQTKAGPYMLAAGINNEYSQASLAILSENGPPTTSPQTEGSEFQCVRGCPAAKPDRYILLPRSELNAASDEPYNIAVRIHARPGGITVQTQELVTGLGAFFDFSQDLQPERVAYSTDYRELHKRFEREGRIKHSFKDCPERKSPAILRICDEHGNWTEVQVPRVPTPD